MGFGSKGAAGRARKSLVVLLGSLVFGLLASGAANAETINNEHSSVQAPSEVKVSSFDENGGFEMPYPLSFGCGESWSIIIRGTNPAGDVLIGGSADSVIGGSFVLTGEKSALPATVKVEIVTAECSYPDPEVPNVTDVEFFGGIFFNVTVSAGSSAGQKQVTARLIHGLESTLRSLKAQRAKMLAAEEELRQRNEVFCGTAGALSAINGFNVISYTGTHHLRQLVGEHVLGHVLCSAIPDVVNGSLDAEGKIAQNERMIHSLEARISVLKGSARSSSRAGTVAYSSSSTGGGAASASVAKLNPLTSLEKMRTQSSTAMGATAGFLRHGKLPKARQAARHAASLLVGLPKACTKAKGYLKTIGLGAKLQRSEIIRVLKRPVPRGKQLARAAGKMHLKPARIRHLIEVAKGIPSSQIKSTAAANLLCNGGLDTTHRALAASFRKLAASL